MKTILSLAVMLVATARAVSLGTLTTEENMGLLAQIEADTDVEDCDGPSGIMGVESGDTIVAVDEERSTDRQPRWGSGSAWANWRDNSHDDDGLNIDAIAGLPVEAVVERNGDGLRS